MTSSHCCPQSSILAPMSRALRHRRRSDWGRRLSRERHDDAGQQAHFLGPVVAQLAPGAGWTQEGVACRHGELGPGGDLLLGLRRPRQRSPARLLRTVRVPRSMTSSTTRGSPSGVDDGRAGSEGHPLQGQRRRLGWESRNHAYRQPLCRGARPEHALALLQSPPHRSPDLGRRYFQGSGSARLGRRPRPSCPGPLPRSAAPAPRPGTADDASHSPYHACQSFSASVAGLAGERHLAVLGAFRPAHIAGHRFPEPTLPDGVDRLLGDPVALGEIDRAFGAGGDGAGLERRELRRWHAAARAAVVPAPVSAAPRARRSRGGCP